MFMPIERKTKTNAQTIPLSTKHVDSKIFFRINCLHHYPVWDSLFGIETSTLSMETLFCCLCDNTELALFPCTFQSTVTKHKAMIIIIFLKRYYIYGNFIVLSQ